MADLPHRASCVIRLFWWVTLLLGVCASPLLALDLPDSTREMLRDLRLDETALVGLDKKLAVPDARLKGARQDDTFCITGAWGSVQFGTMTARA